MQILHLTGVEAVSEGLDDVNNLDGDNDVENTKVVSRLEFGKKYVVRVYKTNFNTVTSTDNYFRFGDTAFAAESDHEVGISGAGIVNKAATPEFFQTAQDRRADLTFGFPRNSLRITENGRAATYRGVTSIKNDIGHDYVEEIKLVVNDESNASSKSLNSKIKYLGDFFESKNDKFNGLLNGVDYRPSKSSELQKIVGSGGKDHISIPGGEFAIHAINNSYVDSTESSQN